MLHAHLYVQIYIYTSVIVCMPVIVYVTDLLIKSQLEATCSRLVQCYLSLKSLDPAHY